MPSQTSTTFVPHQHPRLDRTVRGVWITVTQRFGKPVTVVDGFSQTADVEAILRDLKQHLSVAGRDEHGRLEIQGDQRSRISPLLRDMGAL